VPLGLLCAAGAARWLSRTGGRDHTSPIPLLASVFGTSAVLALVAGLSLSAEHGWASAPTLFVLGLALLLALGFLLNEGASQRVLVERILRRTRSLRVGTAATALYMASVGSEFYLVTLLLQSAQGYGYTPLQAGLAFLPLAAMVTAGSTAAGRAVRRVAASSVLIAGFAIAAVGLIWLTFALSGGAYALDLLPGLLLSGFGHGIIYTSMFIVGTRDVPAAHQGAAGALLTTSQYLAGAVTVAVLTLVLGSTPSASGFRAAFLLTTAAAVAGIAVIAAQGRRGALAPAAHLETARDAQSVAHSQCASTGY
jgi:hypothetical protein